MNIKWKYKTTRYEESVANCYLRDFNASYTHISEGIGHAEILYYPRKWKEIGKRPLTLLSISEINIERWSSTHGSFEDFLSQSMESLSAGLKPNFEDSRFNGFEFYLDNYLSAMENVPVRKHESIFYCSAYRDKKSNQTVIPVSSVNSGLFAGRQIGEPLTIFHSLIGRERFAVPTVDFIRDFEPVDYRLK